MSYTRYYVYKEQETTDGGATWHDTSNTTPSGSPIGVYDTLEECERITPTPSTSGDYLTFIPVVGNTKFTFTFSGESGSDTLYYSLDSGNTWVSLASGEQTPSVQLGSKIMWKANMTPSIKTASPRGIGRFSSLASFDAEGNVMSLLYSDNFDGQTSLNGMSYAFRDLFSSSYVTNAENLVLPATILADGCYHDMFYSCTNLTKAPRILPALELREKCYFRMFWGCSNLTTVPEIHGTNLATYCCGYMFSGCNKLTVTPELPVLTMADYCYAYMFQNCKKISTAPQLPATTLASGCYEQMFSDCSGLTVPPELPAITLKSRCYYDMFKGCKSLTVAPSLPATTLADYCYYEMFSGCTSLETAGVLPASTLASRCYTSMFYGCNNLSVVPDDMLPATTLADYCYSTMFYGCSSLIKAPELPALSLQSSCYVQMFRGCSSLNYIKALFITNINDKPTGIYLTDDWVYGVSGSGTFVRNSDSQWMVIGTDGIPSNWTIQSV